MARAHCTACSLLAPSSNPTRTPPLFLVSSIPSRRPSKATHRKNHLRPKILKIINPKPYPPTLPLLPQEPSPPPQQPAPPILCPQSPGEEEEEEEEEENLLGVEVPASETHGEDAAAATAVEADKLEELQVSEATVEHKGVSGKFSATTIFKFGGVCLVGAFVYQMICSLLFVLNYSSRVKGGNLEVNGREKRDILFNGNNGKSVPVNGSGNVFAVMNQILMEKKVEEIKLMAREARRIEGKKKEGEEDEDYDSDDDQGYVSSPKLGIEREIGARLMKLQNRINSNKDTSAALQINSLGNSAKSAGGVATVDHKNVNQGNEALVFKKKLKFKSSSTKEAKAPKGFTGTRDSKASDAKKRGSGGRGAAINYASDATDLVQISPKDKKVNKQDVETQESISSVLLKERGEFVDDESKEVLNNGKNLEGKMEASVTGVKTKNINKGGVQETSFGVSAVDVHSRESRELSIQKSQGFVDENQDTGPVFEMDVVHSINGSSRHGLARKKSAPNGVKVKEANTKTDMWWLNLRYVLVILMQRGSNGGAKGLYRLKFTSNEQDQSDDSYTVAFEDHVDANNFCFLLESFFKDLGDFTADAVPMSIQEVKEDIISHGKKVVVVKKRQLQLFAGQPLADVEKALCSLIEQDQSVP